MLDNVEADEQVDPKEKLNQRKLIYNAAFKEVAR